MPLSSKPVGFRRIRSKILVIAIGGLLFTSVISTIALNVITRSSLQRRTIDRVQTELEQISDHAVEPILTEDRLALQDLVQQMTEGRPDIQYMYVLSAQREVVATTFVGGVPREILQANLLPVGRSFSVRTLNTERGRMVDVAQGILSGQAGEVHLGVQESVVSGVAEDAVNALLIVQGGALALAILASFMLADILVRPIRQLVAAVRRVGAGDLSTRTGVTSGDEIGQLARAFEVMLEELRRSQEELRELAAQAQGIVSSFPNALFVTDPAGKVRSVNPAAEEFTRQPAARLRGMDLSDLFVTAPDHRPVADLSSALRRDGITLSYAMSLRQASGLPVRVAFNSAPILEEDGRFRGYVVEVRDLRRLRTAIEGLKEQRELLEELGADPLLMPPEAGEEEPMPTHLVRSDRLVSLGQLAASIAHELNNPIFSIITCGKVLERELTSAQTEAVDHERMQRSARTIQSEATRCSKILRSFLQYARLGSPGKDEVGINSILQDVRALILAKAEDQRVELRMDLEEPDRVTADAEQLHQVFLNVALNALQAMPGGGKLELRTRPLPDPPGVEVTVTDSGGGIPAELLSRVFEPFFTTKEKGVGTGLGLAVARSIVRRHGGNIELDSVPGEGTTVRVRLPGSGGEVGREEEKE